MGPTEINGLPAHILFVHAVVVLVPLAALLLVLVATWPAARNRLALTTTVCALLALIAVPLTTHAGEWLQRRVPRTPLVVEHTELGDGLLPWTIGVAVLAAMIWGRMVLAGRRGTSTGASPAHGGGPGAATRTPTTHHGGNHGGPGSGARSLPGGTAATVVLAVLAIAVAVGTVADVYTIGESGSRAAWTDHFSPQSLPGQPHAEG